MTGFKVWELEDPIRSGFGLSSNRLRLERVYDKRSRRKRRKRKKKRRRRERKIVRESRGRERVFELLLVVVLVCFCVCVCISSWRKSCGDFLEEEVWEGDTASGFVKLVKWIGLRFIDWRGEFGTKLYAVV